MTAYYFPRQPGYWAERKSDNTRLQGAAVQFYVAATGGNPVTITPDGKSATTTLYTDSGGSWSPFTGPDGVGVLYVAVNGSARYAVISPDWQAALAGGGGGTGGTLSVTDNGDGTLTFAGTTTVTDNGDGTITFA